MSDQPVDQSSSHFPFFSLSTIKGKVEGLKERKERQTSSGTRKKKRNTNVPEVCFLSFFGEAFHNDGGNLLMAGAIDRRSPSDDGKIAPNVRHQHNMYPPSMISFIMMATV